MSTYVVVTGAASGLGHVIAAEVLSRGHPVVMLDRDDKHAHAAAAELGRQYGLHVPVVVADLSTIGGVHQATDLLTARSDLGALSIMPAAGYRVTSTRTPTRTPGSPRSRSTCSRRCS